MEIVGLLQWTLSLNNMALPNKNETKQKKTKNKNKNKETIQKQYNFIFFVYELYDNKQFLVDSLNTGQFAWGTFYLK